MNEHPFSALDRHAVLTGSDDGFPWFAGADAGDGSRRSGAAAT